MVIFAAYFIFNKEILVIYRKVSSSHLYHLSCDLFPQENIYTVNYKDIGISLPILTPVVAPPPIPSKQSKFWGYIKSCHQRNLPNSDVVFAPKMTFIPRFTFYPCWPPILPPLGPKREPIPPYTTIFTKYVHWVLIWYYIPIYCHNKAFLMFFYDSL